MKCSSKILSESRNNKLSRIYVKLRVLPIVTVVWPIPVAVWSKAYVCGSSIDWIAGSSAAEVRDVPLLQLLRDV